MRAKIIAKKETSIPETIARFINAVCERHRQYGSSIRPPHMIIPLSSGNGRSYLAQAVARQYYKANVLRFSSNTDICLDFTLKETIQSVCQVDTSIQANSGCANEFCGVVALAIDDLLGYLSETPGDKFFNLTRKIKEHATLIIFIPATINQKKLEFVLDKTGAGVKVFSPIEYSDDDFARFFYEFLPLETVSQKTEDIFLQSKGWISDYMDKNIRKKTIKSVKEAAKAVFYDDTANEISGITL